MPADPIRVEGWPIGVDNRAPDHALPEGALRQAINVDVLPDGRVRRRKGFANALSGDYHSLHGAGSAKFGLAVSGGELRRLTHNGSTIVEETVATGLRLNRRMSYADINGVLYYSNGFDCGKIGETGPAGHWAVEMPPARPIVAFATPGLLVAGQYQVMITYVTAAMEESANMAPPVVVTVQADGGAIVLSGIPQPASADVAYIRVYCSTANGAIMFRVADLPDGTTSYTIQSVEAAGRTFRAGSFGHLPVGDLIEHYNGRLYSAVGNVLWESEPFSYGLCNLAEAFTPFPGDITLLAAAIDGLYVAADRTYFLAGPSVRQATMRPVLPYGAVKHASTKRADNDAPIWLSHRGIVEGGDGGQVKNLQEEHVAIVEHEEGSMLFREQDGIKQIVGLATGGQQGQVAKLAASDFAEAEIRRGGISSLREQNDDLDFTDLTEAEVIVP
jgi:hypothetical protein